MNDFPEQYRDLLEKPCLAYLATLMPDGSPQVTPVWFNHDPTFIYVNTVVGRQKYLNMVRDGRVALTIQDPDDPLRYVQIKGEVTGFTKTRADDHIDQLAKKYLGLDSYPWRSASDTRIIFKIMPRKFSSY